MRSASLVLASFLAVSATGTSAPPRPQEIAAAWRDAGGSSTVFETCANGGRPVAIYMPPGFDAPRPVTLQIHFHGHGGDAGSSLLTNGVIARITAVGRKDPQTLFVVPQAADKPFGYWMAAPESFAQLEAESIRVAAFLLPRRPEIVRRIVDAHSGGGLALRNAVASGELRADKINLLDAAYGDWAQVVAQWADTRKIRVESWYTDHSSVARNNLEIAALAPGVVTIHESKEKHGAIPGLYLGTR